MFSRSIRLTALDANYTASQSIRIQIKLPASSSSSPLLLNEAINKTTTNAAASSPKLSWLNLVYFVSAINELEIAYSNKTNSHEVLFREPLQQRNQDKDENNDNNKDEELAKTLAYLIVEKSKFMSRDDTISIEQEQLMNDVLVNSSQLFRVSEMRNGLYSISTSAFAYNAIKAIRNTTNFTSNSNNNTSIYTLRLTIR